MDKSNNKKRILTLIEILRKKTDGNKRLKLDQIVIELNQKGIEVNNRKTLYDDFKILNEFGLNVEYDNGYYLLDAPFNLSEIKIIQDSINSLKNLDNKFIKELNNKMYQYISYDDEKTLNELSYLNKHADNKLLEHMEIIIEAIKNKTSVLIKTKNNSEVNEIFPLFLHRENDYYYFYYHYTDNKKVYHYRFDNIKDLSLNGNVDTLTIQKREILKVIEESSKSYSLGKSELVNIKIIKNSEKLVARFLDDFPNAIHTNDGFSLKADLNNIFFSKIAQYEDDIVITNKNVSKMFKEYLNKILKIY